MEVLKVIIVDDELYGRNNLHNLLNNYCPEVEVIGKAGSASEAKKMIYELNPDSVFLDINMPKVNGFELMESLCERNFLLVIVTAHSEFGIQAVKANAIDYLLKPISIKELQQTVKKLVKIKSESGNSKVISGDINNKIVISHFQGFSIINVDEIVRLKGENNYTKIYLWEKKPQTASRTLKEFESLLPEKYFFRIHKSEIINLKYLEEYSNFDGGLVTLKEGSKLEISRRRLTNFIEKVKIYSRTVKI